MMPGQNGYELTKDIKKQMKVMVKVMYGKREEKLGQLKMV